MVWVECGQQLHLQIVRRAMAMQLTHKDDVTARQFVHQLLK
jgi:hypothetical protein